MKVDRLIISFLVLDGELKMEKVIGSLEIHGENIGANLVMLEWLWEIIN